MLKLVRKSFGLIPLVVASTLLLGLGLSQLAFADTATQAVAQGYSSDSAIQPGMLVMLDSKNSSKVKVLDYNNVGKMLGVVISSSDASIALGSATASNQVYVTNFGRHNVLVSTQNGAIKVGDYVTISNISGIAMKADSSESLVLGQAAGSFNGTSGSVGTATLTSSNGQKESVQIGTIPVDISISSNPLSLGPKGLPTFLKRVTKFATNKSVSAIRVYLAMFIVLVGLVLTITIIYSGIKNGIISLGRNPLAKRAINLSMIRVVLVGIIVFVISLGAAYAVLM